MEITLKLALVKTEIGNESERFIEWTLISS